MFSFCFVSFCNQPFSITVLILSIFIFVFFYARFIFYCAQMCFLIWSDYDQYN